MLRMIVYSTIGTACRFISGEYRFKGLSSWIP
jgi:hypothetical protein